MAGYGNQTAPDYVAEDLTHEHTSTRLGVTDSHDPYSNAHPKYGSGATGGAGFGNKSNPSTTDDSTVSEETRYGLHKDTSPYSGATKIGSGSTAGAGYGNKTGSHQSDGPTDSTVGKLMEKAGHVVHSPALTEKGRLKRDEKKNADLATENGPFAN